MSAADRPRFMLDGREIEFTPGQTILEAAAQAGQYIPHLCWHPDLVPHGSCKLCTVRVDGRFVAGCTAQASAGAVVENRTPQLDDKRRALLQLLFVDGNHFCPGCEKSGDCTLQATAYELGLLGPHFDAFFPDRRVDASHPDFVLDLNRCIGCELCVRASRDLDHKDVFSIGGRGIHSRLIVNSRSGQLADSSFDVSDHAAHICPVGAIIRKRVGFATPIGKRRFDTIPISEQTGAIATGQHDEGKR